MLLSLPVVPRSHHRYYIATTIPCDFNRNQSSTEVILIMHHASWQWMPLFRLYKFTRCKFTRCWHGSHKNLQVKCKMSLNPHINILCIVYIVFKVKLPLSFLIVSLIHLHFIAAVWYNNVQRIQLS